MNDKMKIIGASVLVLGGVGIWVPQLPAMLGGEKSSSTRAPLPAEGEMPPGMPANIASEGPASANPQLPGEIRSDPSGAESDPLARIEALLRDEQEEKEDGLAALAMSWQGANGPRNPTDENTDPSASRQEETSEERVVDPGLERPQATPFGANVGGFGSTFQENSMESIEDPFDAFLSEYPLSGLILGKTRQLASFGPYTLEVGDIIPGTDAKITSIERRSVIVTRDRREFSITLPPFRSNPILSEDLMPGTTTEGDSAGSAPSSSPTASRPVQTATDSGDDQ